MSSHTGRLVLTPVDPMSSPDREGLIQRLGEGGLLGRPLPGLADAFAAGDDLLGLVVFAGCAVTVAVAPGADPESPFCHVVIPPAAPWPRLLMGRNTRPPRCPACRARAMDWRDRADLWLRPPIPGLVCRGCGESHAPWEWDWKQQGGFGRLLVLVEEVFPGEAVPAPRLLALLSGASGQDWHHFYIQD